MNLGPIESASARRLASLALGLVCLGAGCARDEPPSAAPAKRAAARFTTLDGRLSAPLPPDLLVDRFPRALIATAPDGSLRLFIEHVPPTRLLRMVGRDKETLAALGWRTRSERTFQRAAHLVLVRGARAGHAPSKRRDLRRDIWWGRGQGGIVVCDAIARRAAWARLGAPIEALCQHIRLGAPSAAAPRHPSK